MLHRLHKTTDISIALKDRLAGPVFGVLQLLATCELWDLLEVHKKKKVTLTTPSSRALSKLLQLPSIDTFIVGTHVPWHERPGVDLERSTYNQGDWLEPVTLGHIKALDFGTFATFPEGIRKLLSNAKSLEKLSATTPTIRSRNGIHVADMLKAAPNKFRELGILEEPRARFTPDTAVPDFAEKNVPASLADFTSFQYLRILRLAATL
ncbi:hypothetical protein EK21DRAFT_89310 [Setomelanomma holmii]|uniref:Uncharacterized protein n=1 Tax=Setomelanomma holmii TaxID=210430 RepID=A0A9P4LNM9_9PLEO|nr:hypothetical protein EK21DRAFT_89310 [Setomelanomma holmii]